ncbi:N-methyl-L-tryptophan oxidase [soil metagenome]
MSINRRSLLTAAAATMLSPVATAQTVRTGSWDVIVIGAGVFGVWTAWQLLQTGARVLLVDAWGPGHGRASSGGETRLIRTEYRGDPLYTRWAWESLAAWKALSARHELPLFHETGALYLYPDETDVIDRSIAAQRALTVPVEKLMPGELSRRWPQIDFARIAVGVLQPTMGALMARRSVQMLVADFVGRGGAYRQVAVAPPQPASKRLDAVISVDGERLTAGTFVFACGPWLPKLFPEVIGARIVPTRQDVFFFAPPPGDSRFGPERLPAWVDASSPDLHYGFPDIEARGFKIALDRHGPVVDPDAGDRRITDQALTDVRAYLRRRFPALASRPLAEARVCQYENSDNCDLLIDQHPQLSNALIVGCGSGHGFKHGPAVGRYVTGLVTGGGRAEPRLQIGAHHEH